VRSALEFLAVAVVVTITPGPGTATILRVAARDGRGAAMWTVVGTSAGILVWGVLSALGVSSLILASRIAYDVLRVGGAIILVVLGLRSLFARRSDIAAPSTPRVGHLAEWRTGLTTSLSNPKLAVFFVALFPQFITPDAPVLPLALAMATVIVALDVVWFAGLTYAIDRAQSLLRPRLQRRMEQIAGAVMVGLGARLVTETFGRH
jgi:threonine/homoserine/homoserine lactone efflux protein